MTSSASTQQIAPSKDEKFWRILDAILYLETVRGHLRWTISDLAKRAKVSRPGIYYYFGSSKETMLEQALKVVGEEFFGLTPARLHLWRDGRVVEAVLQTRQMVEKAPHLPEFYMHWRRRDSFVRTFLMDLERRYVKKLTDLGLGISSADGHTLFNFFFGICVAPDISPEGLRRLVATVLTEFLGERK